MLLGLLSLSPADTWAVWNPRTSANCNSCLLYTSPFVAERIFQLEPEPPEVGSLNEYILSALQDKDVYKRQVMSCPYMTISRFTVLCDLVWKNENIHCSMNRVCLLYTSSLSPFLLYIDIVKISKIENLHNSTHLL